MIVLIIFSGNKSYSQFNESNFSFNYTLAPIGNDGIDFYKTDIKLSIPIKLKKGILVNSLGLDYYQLNYKNDYSFTTTDLTTFYGINYSLMYIYPLSKQWSLSAQVRSSIVSNLTGGIDGDDFLINGGLFAIKNIGTKEKPSRLMFGIGYTTIAGTPQILPTINYTKHVSDKFSYGIGFPNTYAEYKINDRSALKSLLWLNGFYANLSNPIFVNTTDMASKVSFTSASLGLEYNYNMDKSWIISFKGGYSFYNDYSLFDSDGDRGDTVFDFDTTSKPFFSTGIKYILKNKTKNISYEKQ